MASIKTHKIIKSTSVAAPKNEDIEVEDINLDSEEDEEIMNAMNLDEDLNTSNLLDDLDDDDLPVEGEDEETNEEPEEPEETPDDNEEETEEEDSKSTENEESASTKAHKPVKIQAIKEAYVDIDTTNLVANEKTGLYNVSTEFLVKAFAKACGIDIPTANAIHNNYWIVLKSILAQPKMGQLSLTKYGTFRTKYVPKGEGINPKLSKKGDIHMQEIPAHMRLSFSTGNTLKEAVNKQVPAYEKKDAAKKVATKKVIKK